ncbi:MAG: YncE family protein [bacterium]
MVAAIGQAQYLETVVDLGRNAHGLLWNPVSNKVYTSNSDNTVSIIDGATNTLIATVDVPDYPGALAWNPHTNKVYCACVDDRRLVAIDGETNAITANIALPGCPSQAAFSRTSNKLYVGDDDGRVTVVDGRADTVLRTVRLQQNGDLLMVWHPTTNRLLCSSAFDTLLALDCAGDTLVARVPTGSPGGGYIWCVQYNPASGFVYVGGWRGVLALTPACDSVVARVPGYVYRLCAVPLPDKLYLDRWHDQFRIGILDCGSHTVLDSILLCQGPMVCDPVSGKVYVSYLGLHDSLGVIDARADTAIAMIPCSGAGNDVCWNATNSRAYFATNSHLVYVVRDTATAVAEPQVQAVSRRPSTTSVVPVGSEWASAETGCLLDPCGRRVAEVRQGLNLLCGLPAGVYVAVTPDGRVSARLMVVRR